MERDNYLESAIVHCRENIKHAAIFHSREILPYLEELRQFREEKATREKAAEAERQIAAANRGD